MQHVCAGPSLLEDVRFTVLRVKSCDILYGEDDDWLMAYILYFIVSLPTLPLTDWASLLQTVFHFKEFYC